MPKKFASVQERRTYQSWADMRNRCNNARHARFDNYGGRGIKVCERWTSFEAFLEDMGLKPDGLTLERLNNDAGYSPDNCCWASYRQQNKNKQETVLYEYDGRKQSIEDWADEFEIPRTTLSHRIHHYKWPLKVALHAETNEPYNIPDDPEKAKHVRCLNHHVAEQMRQMYAEGGWSFRSLGRYWGVSGMTVSRVIKNQTWVRKHDQS